MSDDKIGKIESFHFGELSLTETGMMADHQRYLARMRILQYCDEQGITEEEYWNEILNKRKNWIEVIKVEMDKKDESTIE